MNLWSTVRQHWQFTAVLAGLLAAILVWLAVPSPSPSPICGTLEFPDPTQSGGGVVATLSFLFEPSSCGAPPCACSKVVYLQMTRVVDPGNGFYWQPGSQQRQRMTRGQDSKTNRNGWAIDRLDDNYSAYFGLNNDGTWSSAVPGDASHPATMTDAADGWPEGVQFEAVTVPVCIEGDDVCINRLLGAYYWGFVVPEPTVPVRVTRGRVGFLDYRRDVLFFAITEWDKRIGKSKTALPSMQFLP
jgi:hypothetical protein